MAPIDPESLRPIPVKETMEPMKVLVTGAAGFVAGYLIEELLRGGHEVVGLDNHARYGRLTRPYDAHPSYRFVVGDAKDIDQMCELAEDCDQIVALAARVGGISYGEEHAYDLMAENERITASTFDAAIQAHQGGKLQKINIISAASVFESSTTFPTPEGAQLSCPPPPSLYGLQKLACEYFARAAWQQYRLPYTIIRPCGCVGPGTSASNLELLPGNHKLAMSHVVPEVVHKVLQGQDPLHLLGDGEQLRSFTHGQDIARGIVACMLAPAATNQELNIAAAKAASVLDVARLAWAKVHPGKPFAWTSDPALDTDVAARIPDVSKARELLGFEATTSLDAIVDELIAWVRAHELGT